MQTSSPPVITPNRSQSNPDDVITLPRPIQSVGMNLHNVSGTSTGQTLPRERRAPPGIHFCPTIGWVYPHLLLFLSSTHFCPLFHPLLSEIYYAGRPGSSEVPRNPPARWDVSSIPANGIFLTKNYKTKIKMPNGWRTIKSLVHKNRLHGRRGKGMAESFSREKLRHAPQKEGG